MNLDKYIQFMKEKHKGQLRKQGTPYYEHPLRVSEMLKEKGFGLDYQVAGLFHDLLEDTNTKEDEILELSNEQVLRAVKLVSKEVGYTMDDYVSRIKNNNMALMVKLADRIDNLRDSVIVEEKFRIKYVEETEEWYLDVAKNTVFENDLKEAYELIKNTLNQMCFLLIYFNNS